jgi:hypothetical protein
MIQENPARHYFEALTEGSGQIFYACDIASQKFSLLNPAFEKVWRKTRKSVLGDPAMLLETIHPEDKQHVQRIYQELLDGVIIKDVEFRIVLRDKTERRICIKPWLLAEELVLIGSADEIGAQKEYNNYLKKYSDKKNSILNMLSHDLAGPLGIINNLPKMLGLSSGVKELGGSIIYTVPVTGGTPKQITPKGPSYLQGWSPDGKYLIFTAGRKKEFDIYRVPSKG